MKQYLKTLALGGLLSIGATTASAALLDDYFYDNGDAATGNLCAGSDCLIEDDSGELQFRFDQSLNDGAGGFAPVLTGPIQVGDILVGVLDFPEIVADGNVTNLDTEDVELNSILLGQVTKITDVGTRTTSGDSGIYNYDAVDLEFGTVSAAVWAAITGIDLNAIGVLLGVDMTDTAALFWEDDDNNLDIFSQTYQQALAATTDGDLVGVLGLTSPGDFSAAFGVPGNVDSFNPAEDDGTPGVTQLGLFAYTGTWIWDDLAPEENGLTGSGVNLVTGLDGFPIQDDTQGTFIERVPEPSVVLLMAVGFLGLGLFSRRRNALS